jgi:hypothetical protein
MTIEVKTDKELESAIQKDNALILITIPISCPSCRHLEAMMKEKEPKSDVYVVDVGRHGFIHNILMGVRSIPTVIQVKEDKTSIHVGQKAFDKIYE